MKTVWHWPQIGKCFAGGLVLALGTLPFGFPLWVGLVIGWLYGMWAADYFDLWHFEEMKDG